MKRLIRHFQTVAMIATFLILPVAAMAQGITGTSHDFTLAGNPWNTTGEICIVCHTPHGGSITVNAPLWNHTTTTATFTTYDSPTMDATTGAPTGVSLMCLSCHDGTVAIDSFGVSPTTTVSVTGIFLVGTDLSNDHPISMLYDDTNDLGLNDPDVAGSSGLPGGGSITDDMLFAGEMQCASCHDPHDDAGLSNFLVKSNAGSLLCLTCHDK
jgi:predicted CXXCH cytochrome family protein